jgi:hypothetical protein
MRNLRPVPLLLVLCLASVALSTSAESQRRAARQTPRRSGFWFSGGLGLGSFGCDGCDRQTGLSGGLSAGGTLSPRVLLGGGISGWTKSESGATLNVSSLDARIRFYPAARGRLFLTGGLGLGRLSSRVSGVALTDQNGSSLLAGAGMDFSVSRNASVTPYANLLVVRTDRNTVNVTQLGAAITLH